MSALPALALLDLCQRLGEQPAEWQRLYDAIPDDGPRTGAGEA